MFFLEWKDAFSIFAAGISIFALVKTQKNADMSGFMWAFNTLHKVLKHRKLIDEKAPREWWVETLTDEENAEINELITCFQEIATVCMYNTVTSRIIEETCSGLLLEVWVKTKDYVRIQLRNGRGQPVYLNCIYMIGSYIIPVSADRGGYSRMHFEIFAQRCAQYLKKNHPTTYKNNLLRYESLGYNVNDIFQGIEHGTSVLSLLKKPSDILLIQPIGHMSALFGRQPVAPTSGA